MAKSYNIVVLPGDGIGASCALCLLPARADPTQAPR
jgi:hypothetical protein